MSYAAKTGKRHAPWKEIIQQDDPSQGPKIELSADISEYLTSHRPIIPLSHNVSKL